MDTVKHQHSDLQSKHAVLHSLNEQMKQSLMNYETQQDKHMKMENDLKYLQGNVEEFTIKNSKQKDTIADLKYVYIIHSLSTICIKQLNVALFSEIY